jgi:hypothetical protein
MRASSIGGRRDVKPRAAALALAARRLGAPSGIEPHRTASSGIEPHRAASS